MKTFLIAVGILYAMSFAVTIYAYATAEPYPYEEDESGQLEGVRRSREAA